MTITEEMNNEDVDDHLKDLLDLCSRLHCWVDDGGDRSLFFETLPGGEVHLKHDLNLASSHLDDLIIKLLEHLL